MIDRVVLLRNDIIHWMWQKGFALWFWGIAINDGGRGFIFVLKPRFLYLCFWTKWFAPRLTILDSKIEFSVDP